MATATIPTVPGVRPIVEIGVGTVNEPGGTAVWQPTPGPGIVATSWQSDSATVSDHDSWVGDQPLYLDVSCHVREFTTFAGRDRSIDRWEIGTATIICENVDGWADYPPTGHLDHPLLTMRPGRQVRVGVAVDDRAPVYLWGGYIDRTAPAYDPEVGETVEIECIDAKGEAGRGFVAEIATPAGAGESATARINRVLTANNWPSYRRNIASTGVNVRGTTLGAQCVDLLDIAGDSSGGVVYGDVNGNVAFRSRDNVVFDPELPIDGQIGNVYTGVSVWDLDEDLVGSGLYDPGVVAFVEDPAGSGLYELGDVDFELHEDPPGSRLYFLDADLTPTACPSLWEMSFGREDISSRVVLSRPDDVTPIIRNSVAARALYGIETFERSDLETNLDSELGQIADRALNVRSPDYMPRVAAVTLDAATGRGVVDVLCVASPYTPAQFRCGHRSEDGRDVIASRTMMVTAAEHTLSPDGWLARLSLDDVGPFTVTSITRWQADTGGPPPEARWENATTPTTPYARWQTGI